MLDVQRLYLYPFKQCGCDETTMRRRRALVPKDEGQTRGMCVPICILASGKNFSIFLKTLRMVLRRVLSVGLFR
jgi:hypothetical protein